MPAVGEDREERLLVGELAAERVGDTDGPGAVGVDQRAALVGPAQDVVDQHPPVDQIDPSSASRQRPAVEHQIAGIVDDRRNAGGDERVPQDLELGPGRDLVPVHNGNRWRVRAPAPLRIAGEQRRQHRVDRAVIAGRQCRSRNFAITGSRSKISASFWVYPRPAGDSALYSAKCRESGSRNAVQAGSGARRLVARVDRREADLRVGHSELVQERRRGHRRLGDSLAGRGDCLGRSADPLFVPTRQEKRAQEWTVQTISERQFLLAQRGGKMPAGVGAHLVGAQERAPLGREIHHCCPGAPVNPDVWPIPSISSQRGQDCDGRPLSARSITSSVIFSTTCEK